MLITDETMTSDRTHHTARYSKDAAADARGAWRVTWLPKRLLTRNQAVTAMTIAEHVAEHSREIAEFGKMMAEASMHSRPWWLHLTGWCAELSMNPSDAVAAITTGSPVPARPRFARAEHIAMPPAGDTLTIGVTLAGDVCLTGPAVQFAVLVMPPETAAAVTVALSNLTGFADGVKRAPIV